MTDDFDPFKARDEADKWWTLDRCVEESGLTERTIRSYRLPFAAGLIHRDIFWAERQRRGARKAATRQLPRNPA